MTKAVFVIPPLFRILNEDNRVITPGITHDAALLRDKGISVVVINGDYSEGTKYKIDRLTHLFNESWILASESDELSDRIQRTLEALVQDIEAENPDIVFVYCGDWAVPAKDYADISITCRLGELLHEHKFLSVALGSKPTKHPGHFLECFDAVVEGIPGEALLEAIKVTKGNKRIIQGSGITPYITLMPEIRNIKPEGCELHEVISEFGCEYGKCVFCHVPDFYGKGKSYPKTNDSFIEDVMRRNDETHIYIVDTFFGHDTERLKYMAPRLAQTEKKFRIDVRIEVANDDEKLDLYKLMGVHAVNIGIESLADTRLKEMKKGQKREEVLGRLHNLQEMGFIIRAYVLLGTDGETPEEMKESLDQARLIDAAIPNISWFPNIFCELDNTSLCAHHFSRPQAHARGVPDEILDEWLALSRQSMQRLRKRRSAPANDGNNAHPRSFPHT